MKPVTCGSARKAFTLIELLLLIALILFAVLLAVPMWTGRGPKPPLVLCMNNLRQIGVGFMLYCTDNSNQPPWQVSRTDSKAADLFLKLTPYLPQPKTFVCAADKSRQLAAAGFSGFSHSNLSYFASLDASIETTLSPATLLLAGDRHLAIAGQAVNPGRLSITNTGIINWTRELHHVEDTTKTVGALLFLDGHCEAVPSQKLAAALQKQGLATNSLVIP